MSLDISSKTFCGHMTNELLRERVPTIWDEDFM